MPMNKIFFFNNNLSGMVCFRKEVMQNFIDKGYDVSVIAPAGECMEMIHRLPDKVKYIPVKMNRASTNPLDDLLLFCQVLKILHREKPDYLFNYTIKPNIYGAIAAKVLGIRCSDMIAGLGFTFTNDKISSKIARTLYKIAGRCVEKMVVLNRDNYNTILSTGICNEDKLYHLIGGEGVDLKRYPYYPNDDKKCRFFFIGRLIEEKGYHEFVTAAKRIRTKYPNAEFHIVGGFDKDYPKRISENQVKKDEAESGVFYHGNVDNMATIYSERGVVIVIPSYYSEGLNRSLMEGCASGKPIITTDWPGCRETVKDGINGFLARPRDVNSLTKSIERYLSLSNETKENFSIASRKLAEQIFEIDGVINFYESCLDFHQKTLR